MNSNCSFFLQSYFHMYMWNVPVCSLVSISHLVSQIRHCPSLPPPPCHRSVLTTWAASHTTASVILFTTASTVIFIAVATSAAVSVSFPPPVCSLRQIAVKVRNFLLVQCHLPRFLVHVLVLLVSKLLLLSLLSSIYISIYNYVPTYLPTYSLLGSYFFFFPCLCDPFLLSFYFSLFLSLFFFSVALPCIFLHFH